MSDHHARSARDDVYDHEHEEPRPARRRRPVADWGVGDDVFEQMPRNRFPRAADAPPRERRFAREDGEHRPREEDRRLRAVEDAPGAEAPEREDLEVPRAACCRPDIRLEPGPDCATTTLQDFPGACPGVLDSCVQFRGSRSAAPPFRVTPPMILSGGAGNRTRVLRCFVRASPSAAHYVSTRPRQSHERVGVTGPVADWSRRTDPATGSDWPAS